MCWKTPAYFVSRVLYFCAAESHDLRFWAWEMDHLAKTISEVLHLTALRSNGIQACLLPVRIKIVSSHNLRLGLPVHKHPFSPPQLARDFKCFGWVSSLPKLPFDADCHGLSLATGISDLRSSSVPGWRALPGSDKVHNRDGQTENNSEVATFSGPPKMPFNQSFNPVFAADVVGLFD